MSKISIGINRFIARCVFLYWLSKVLRVLGQMWTEKYEKKHPPRVDYSKWYGRNEHYDHY